jgi:hypothetical protein
MMKEVNMSNNNKKTNKVSMSSSQWVIAGIKDGSLVITDNGIMLNASAFSTNKNELIKQAQRARTAPAGIAGAAAAGINTGASPAINQALLQEAKRRVSTVRTPFVDTLAKKTIRDATGKSTFLGRMADPGLVAKNTPLNVNNLSAAQNSLLRAPGNSVGNALVNSGGAVNTPGLASIVSQPGQAGATAFNTARGAGSGRVMSTLQGARGAAGAVPSGARASMSGIRGALVGGGFRGAVVGGGVAMVGSLGAWAVHKGAMAAWDWARGANEIPGHMRTQKGAQDFSTAQETLASKVMPYMYGQASGPNEKLDKLNSLIAEMSKQLESDPGYQAALSGQMADVSAPANMPQDLSAPQTSAGEFNPANMM